MAAGEILDKGLLFQSLRLGSVDDALAEVEALVDDGFAAFLELGEHGIVVGGEFSRPADVFFYLPGIVTADDVGGDGHMSTSVEAHKKTQYIPEE